MRLSVNKILEMKANNDKITMLTCTDASFAKLLDDEGIDIFLIGDSLGMVIQGFDSTIPVSIDDINYHMECCIRTSKKALILADMPFGTYPDPQIAYENAVFLMQNGASMVKLEGGENVAPIIAYLVERGIPVCGHIGLTPQSINLTGSYKIQGKNKDQVDKLIKDGLSIQNAGATMTVLELMPTDVGKQITEKLDIPTIGIGAGKFCDGQVLNLYDMLDVYPAKKPKFAKNFLAGNGSIKDAIKKYVEEVKNGTFPDENYSY